MELQMAGQAAKSTGRATPPHHHGTAGGSGGARPVPGYLRPSTGSCHHVCKYGGTHEFEDKVPTTKKKKLHPKPRKPAPAPASADESQSKVMVKVRSVFRRRVGDSSTAAAAASKAKQGGGENVGVEWKDIVAYDTTVPHRDNKTSTAPVIAGSGGDAKKKANTDDVTKSVMKPPKGKTKKKKKPTSLVVEEMAAMDQEALHGYEILSPSVMQSRTNLLRDLQEEMAVHGAAAAADAEEEETAKPPPPPPSLNEEEYAAMVAAETSRPIPAHRRAKSMSISSRSVRLSSNPITRQASKNSAVTFKLKSRSTKAPPIASPEEEEKPAMARMRSRRGGGEDGSSGSGGGGGRGIQFRIRSLRRRGLGGGVGSGGFVVPAVALRHQKTLEKKKSQRLYNNMIEETASKLVKTRKSRVKALVGAFESVINKIAK